ncbi:hypothetical protein C8Q80DRAFT_859236 [Daedaleopsis nitida]|nr:hypothetical protein C8Q80DRAFT_859236 [Daedaleopsis nitida]
MSLHALVDSLYLSCFVGATQTQGESPDPHSSPISAGSPSPAFSLRNAMAARMNGDSPPVLQRRNCLLCTFAPVSRAAMLSILACAKLELRPPLCTYLLSLPCVGSRFGPPAIHYGLWPRKASPCPKLLLLYKKHSRTSYGSSEPLDLLRIPHTLHDSLDHFALRPSIFSFFIRSSNHDIRSAPSLCRGRRPLVRGSGRCRIP